EVTRVDRIDVPDRERDAVEDDRLLAPDPIEHRAGATAGLEEVLGDDLEPLGLAGAVLEDLAEVLFAQADSVAEVLKHRVAPRAPLRVAPSPRRRRPSASARPA